MKINLVQFSGSSLFITPAHTGKRPAFGARRGFAFPPALRGAPLADPPAFARFLRSCAQKMHCASQKYIFSFENDELVSREYHHLPAKQKRLAALARLEAETILPEGAAEYIVENYEYGFLNEVTGKYTAMLYATKAGFLQALLKACSRAGVRVVRIIPPSAGLLAAVGLSVSTKGKSVALINIGACSSHLLLLNNDEPLSQRSFLPVYDELLELVAAERGLSSAEAAALIAREGFSPDGLDAPGPVSSLLDASIGELLRNLRMLLSSERLELDAMILSGSMTTLPGFMEYWQRLALDIPTKTLGEAALPGTLPRLIAGPRSASQNATAHFLSQGLLSLAHSGTCDFLRDSRRRSSELKGNAAILGFITVVAVLCMCMQPLVCFLSSQRAAADELALADTRFNEVKDLERQRLALSAELNSLSKDAALLPAGLSGAHTVLSELFSQLSAKVKLTNSLGFDSATGTVTLAFTTTSYSSFLTVRNAIIKNGVFTVKVPFSATIGEGGECACTATLMVTDFKPLAAATPAPPAQTVEDLQKLADELLAQGGKN